MSWGCEYTHGRMVGVVTARFKAVGETRQGGQ